MQIRLYLDEDAMDSDLVHALRMHGVDVTTALDVGLIEHYDNDHLAFAASQSRALSSFNAGDYLALHSAYLTQGRHHAGIILAAQQRYSVGEQMRRLLRIINLRSAEAIQDQVEFLRGYPETLSPYCCDIMQHSCGNETQGCHKDEAY